MGFLCSSLAKAPGFYESAGIRYAGFFSKVSFRVLENSNFWVGLGSYKVCFLLSFVTHFVAIYSQRGAILSFFIVCSTLPMRSTWSEYGVFAWVLFIWIFELLFHLTFLSILDYWSFLFLDRKSSFSEISSLLLLLFILCPVYSFEYSGVLVFRKIFGTDMQWCVVIYLYYAMYLVGFLIYGSIPHDQRQVERWYFILVDTLTIRDCSFIFAFLNFWGDVAFPIEYFYLLLWQFWQEFLIIPMPCDQEREVWWGKNRSIDIFGWQLSELRLAWKKVNDNSNGCSWKVKFIFGSRMRKSKRRRYANTGADYENNHLLSIPVHLESDVSIFFMREFIKVISIEVVENACFISQ